jgi:cell wall-associated NlpC family hydrolase
MEKAVAWALQVAADNRHGYSQGAENATSNNPYTGSREGPDYDCSSLVYHALEQAGFPIIAAWQKNPDYYKLYNGKQLTGDADTIWPDLQKIGGFTKYSWAEVKDNLQRGDILCRPEAHVAIYIGNGKTVEARGVNNPKGGEYRTGDQGGEIDCYSAYGRGWTEVYRYTGK